MYDEDINYADDDPRLDAWIAFRRGENPEPIDVECCECHQRIPDEDDVIELFDTEENGKQLLGRLCEKCAGEE